MEQEEKEKQRKKAEIERYRKEKYEERIKQAEERKKKEEEEKKQEERKKKAMEFMNKAKRRFTELPQPVVHSGIKLLTMCENHIMFLNSKIYIKKTTLTIIIG